MLNQKITTRSHKSRNRDLPYPAKEVRKIRQHLQPKNQKLKTKKQPRLDKKVQINPETQIKYQTYS